MSKKAPAALLSVILVLTMVLCLCTGCDFSTTIISDSDHPEIVFQDFFNALKQKDFDKADSFLADNSTIRPSDNSGYSFMEALVDVSLDSMSYQVIRQPEYDHTAAVMRVSITSLDKEMLINFITDHMEQILNDYMLQQGINTVDPEDHEQLSQVLTAAILQYSADAQTINNEIDVNFIYSDNQWKIVGNNNLVVAVFGGNVNEK